MTTKKKTDPKVKAKQSPWVEIRRTEVGLYASGPCSGPGWSNPGYFHLVYEVTERLGDTYRTRVVNGEPCHLVCEEGYAAFVSLYSRYRQHAREHDKLHKQTEAGTCYDKRFPYQGEDGKGIR